MGFLAYVQQACGASLWDPRDDNGENADHHVTTYGRRTGDAQGWKSVVGRTCIISAG